MTRKAFVIIIVLLAAGFAACRDSYLMGIYILVCFYAMISVGWNLAAGFTGLLSLGQALFVGIGAYSVAYGNITFGLSPLVSLPFALALSVVVAVGIGSLCFRYGIRGQYFAICTLTFSEIAFLLVSSAAALGRSDGIMMRVMEPRALHLQFRDKWPYGLMIAVSLVATLWLSAAMLKTKYGFYWRALRDNEDAARALGVPAFKYKLLVFAISAVTATFGGAFYASYTNFVDPGSVLGVELSIQLLVFSIVGGMGAVWGPVLGAAFLIPLSEFLRTSLGSNTHGVDIVLYAVILIVVVLRFPKGIAGIIEGRPRKAGASDLGAEGRANAV